MANWAEAIALRKTGKAITLAIKASLVNKTLILAIKCSYICKSLRNVIFGVFFLTSRKVQLR